MADSEHQDAQTTQTIYAAILGAMMWLIAPSSYARGVVLLLAVCALVYILYKGHYVRDWSTRKKHAVAPAVGMLLLIGGTAYIIPQWRREHPAHANVRAEPPHTKSSTQPVAQQTMPSPPVALTVIPASKKQVRQRQKLRSRKEPVPEHGVTVGNESVGMGNIPNGSKIGDRSVLIGPTDSNGNTRVGPGAYGYCAGSAIPDPTSTYAGAYAGSGGRCIPPPTQVPVTPNPKQEK